MEEAVVATATVVVTVVVVLILVALVVVLLLLRATTTTTTSFSADGGGGGGGSIRNREAAASILPAPAHGKNYKAEPTFATTIESALRAMTTFSTQTVLLAYAMWEFAKIGDPNIVP